MKSDNEKLRVAQTAVADYLRGQNEPPIASPASTLRTSCCICGSVYKKPWAEKASTLCKNGCYWILDRHIAWDGTHRKVKFFTAAAIPLFASYKTYDQLQAAGRRLDTLVNSR